MNIPKIPPLELIRQAKQIARDHGYYVVERGPWDKREYILYREQRGFDPYATGRGVRVGKRTTAEGLYSLVCKTTGFE